MTFTRHAPAYSPDFGGGHPDIDDRVPMTLAADTARRVERLVPTVHITGVRALRHALWAEDENPTGAQLLLSTDDRKFFLLAARKRMEHPQLRLVGKNLDLSRANLVGRNLEEAVLAGCDLSEADLRQSNIANTEVTGANLENIIIGVPSTEFAGVDFASARFERVRLHVEEGIGPEIFRSVEEVAPGAGIGRFVTLSREEFLAFVRSYVGDTV